VIDGDLNFVIDDDLNFVIDGGWWVVVRIVEGLKG